MKRRKDASMTEKAMQALTVAVSKVIEEHRRRGIPLAIWRDGRAVSILASEIGALREKPIPYRTRTKPEE